MTPLFLDIETIPSSDMPDLEDVIVSKVLKRLDKIAAAKVLGQESQYRNEALNPLKGRILCIALDYKEKQLVFAGEDESILISQFANWFRPLSSKDKLDLLVVGHYISSFDIPFILTKLIQYGYKDVANNFPQGGKSKHILDFHEYFNFGRYPKEHFKQDVLAKFLSIPISKSIMDGSQVYDYWQKGALQEIYNYCQTDIMTCKLIYNKIK